MVGNTEYESKRPEFHEYVSPDALLHKYPDVWLEQLPGWITTHTMARYDYWLIVRQKHYLRRHRCPKICARFTPDPNRESGIKITIRGEDPITTVEQFFEILLTKKNRLDTRLGFNFKISGLCKVSEDYILDTYKFQSLLERHNERTLAALRSRQPPTLPTTLDVDTVLAKIA